MKEIAFDRRIELVGRPCRFEYENDVVKGRVEAWKYGDQYMLSWAEYPLGKNHDKSAYSKNLSLTFDDLSALKEYIRENNLPLEDFQT